MLEENITQRALAEKLGISPAALNNYLTGDKAFLTSMGERVLAALGLELVVREK